MGKRLNQKIIRKWLVLKHYRDCLTIMEKTFSDIPVVNLAIKMSKIAVLNINLKNKLVNTSSKFTTGGLVVQYGKCLLPACIKTDSLQECK